MEKTVNWNIIFLIYAELTDSTIADPTEVVSNDVPVSIQINQLNELLLKTQLSDSISVFMISNQVEIKNQIIVGDKTKLFHLVEDIATGPNRPELMKEFTFINFAQKYQHISQAFQLIESFSQADRTLLITWDHGSAFGIFKKKLTDPKTHRNWEAYFNKNFVTLDHQEPITIVRNTTIKYNPSFYDAADKLEGSVQSDDLEFNTILSTDHLADAISEGLKKKCVDALLMYNCDMQNMHTCYSLRKCVDYLIAPEAAIASPAYDFKAIIEFIGLNGGLDVDGSMVAIKAIESLIPFYTSLGQVETLNRYAIFAVSLKNYEKKIIGFMRVFISQMIKSMRADEKLRQDVISERQKCFDFGHKLHYYQVDFINFLYDLSVTLSYPELPNYYQFFQIAYDSIIIAKLVGNDIYPNGNGSWEQVTKTPPKGVSIYFPDGGIDKRDYIARKFIIPDGPFSSSLMSEIGWAEFLNVLKY